jgi:hypothetical protein
MIAGRFFNKESCDWCLELLLITIKYLRPIVVPSREWNEVLMDQEEC